MSVFSTPPGSRLACALPLGAVALAHRPRRVDGEHLGHRLAPLRVGDLADDRQQLLERRAEVAAEAVGAVAADGHEAVAEVAGRRRQRRHLLGGEAAGVDVDEDDRLVAGEPVERRQRLGVDDVDGDAAGAQRRRPARRRCPAMPSASEHRRPAPRPARRRSRGRSRPRRRPARRPAPGSGRGRCCPPPAGCARRCGRRATSTTRSSTTSPSRSERQLHRPGDVGVDGDRRPRRPRPRGPAPGRRRRRRRGRPRRCGPTRWYSTAMPGVARAVPPRRRRRRRWPGRRTRRRCAGGRRRAARAPARRRAVARFGAVGVDAGRRPVEPGVGLHRELEAGVAAEAGHAGDGAVGHGVERLAHEVDAPRPDRRSPSDAEPSSRNTAATRSAGRSHVGATRAATSSAAMPTRSAAAARHWPRPTPRRRRDHHHSSGDDGEQRPQRASAAGCRGRWRARRPARAWRAGVRMAWAGRELGLVGVGVDGDDPLGPARRRRSSRSPGGSPSGAGRRGRPRSSAPPGAVTVPPADRVDREGVADDEVGRRQGGAGQVGEQPVDEDREGDLQRQVRVADRERQRRQRQPADRAPHEQRRRRWRPRRCGRCRGRAAGRWRWRPRTGRGPRRAGRRGRRS